MKTILFFIAGVSMLAVAAVAPIVALLDRPYDPLLDQLCSHETMAHRRAEYAVNRQGHAWGRCQVKYWSAVAFGGFDDQLLQTGIPSRNPGELFDDDVNIETAGRILELCRQVKGRRSTRLLVYCYGAGPNSRPYSNLEHRRFSKQIAVDFAEKRRGLDFANLQ